MSYVIGADPRTQQAYKDGEPHLCDSCNKGRICKWVVNYTWDCSLWADREKRLQAHAVRNTGNYVHGLEG